MPNLNLFDWIVRMIDRAEVSAITLIAKIIPIVVPFIPAQIGFMNVTNTTYGLGWPPELGWSYAITIECLGYAAIYIGMKFWESNRRQTTNKNEAKAPLFIVIVIYIVYLIVTLTVNAVLEYKGGIVGYKVITTMFVSILSLPAGLLVAVSAIHTERTIAAEEAKAKAVEERREANAQRRAEREQALRLQNEQTERTPGRTNARTNGERPPRTNAPQLVPTNEQAQANEQRLGFPTNEQGDPNEHSDLADLPPGERVRIYIERTVATTGQKPGQSQIARAVMVSKSTADAGLRRYDNGER